MDGQRPPANNASKQDGVDYKQQVLAAVELVELVGRTVSLKRAGRNYQGLCPFHSEKSPSFSVNPAKQFFHCFGCKASGNAIDFVMKRDRLEFLDAMRLLGDAAGIERPHSSPRNKQAAGQRQQLLDACSAAAACFQKVLAHPTAGAAGRAYLEDRGFTAETIAKFQVGLAADAWDALLRADAMRAFPPALLATAGLIKPRETGGGFYDTFRNRLMFPIRDETGRVVAFGGRVMPGSQDKAKYLNSPETPLFNKGRTVFGLDLGRQKIVESRTVAVVEGYTDVVMAHQYGATNVVSVLGTALTEGHVGILRRFADRIVLLFDPDTAGDTAVNRAVELFLTQPVEVAIASLPDGMDPDEYLLAHGAEALDGILKGAADALTFKWKQLYEQFRQSGDDLTARHRAAKQYLDLLAKARGSGPVDPMRWGSALARVSRLTDIPIAELNRQFRLGAEPATPQPGPGGPGRPDGNGRREGGFNQGGFNGGRPRQSAVEAYLHPDKWASYRNKGSGGSSYGNGSTYPQRQGGPIGSAAAGLRANQPTARDRSERWILAVLLAEPHRWAGLVDRVHVSDFTDEGRRHLAELYWQQQQDEGEPVFNEFLGTLAATPTGDEHGPGVDLADLAVGLMDEFDRLEDPGLRLAEALALIDEMRAGGERDKLVAQLRRTSGADPAASAGADATDSLRQLQERARRPDLRRFGS